MIGHRFAIKANHYFPLINALHGFITYLQPLGINN